MKKFLFGLMVGFFLAVGISAHAEVKSYVGEVIEGEYSVWVNGTLLNTKAIVIKGTSFLPVRAVGDALGVRVNFDSKRGIELAKGDAIMSKPPLSLFEKIEYKGVVYDTVHPRLLEINGRKLVPISSLVNSGILQFSFYSKGKNEDWLLGVKKGDQEYVFNVVNVSNGFPENLDFNSSVFIYVDGSYVDPSLFGLRVYPSNTDPTMLIVEDISEP